MLKYKIMLKLFAFNFAFVCVCVCVCGDDVRTEAVLLYQLVSLETT
jgi:hypothetical protein